MSCRHWYTDSIADDCTVALSRSVTSVAYITSCTSNLPLPFTSLSAGSALCTNSIQTIVSTKRKRKFPGPAGALPKLVS